MRLGLEHAEAPPAGFCEGNHRLVLPLELGTPTENSGAFGEENYGDEPEVSAHESHGKPAEEDDGGPDECQRAESAGRLLQDGEAEGKGGELLLGCVICVAVAATSGCGHWGELLSLRFEKGGVVEAEAGSSSI